ncbi:anti-sigma factor [Kribbella sp. NBC_01505]|uniref:anti-sigma factor n=1 Tax=Kribbella sp. NBC_01505 TaxID=2903580 RepID=UPI0038654F3D
MPVLDAHALAGPYVLNALPDKERIEFELHLQSCPYCTTEVGELRDAAARLAAGFTTKPPRRLKPAVLTLTAQTRQLRNGDHARTARGRLRSLLALAAAVVAIAASGAVVVSSQRARVSADATNDQVSAVLSEPDARTLSSSVTGGGRATIVASAHRDAAVVILRELRALPTGSTYELWMLDASGKARPVGTAAADQLKIITGGIADAAAFSLSVEPTGGSPEPTLPVVSTVAIVPPATG